MIKFASPWSIQAKQIAKMRPDCTCFSLYTLFSLIEIHSPRLALVLDLDCWRCNRRERWTTASLATIRIPFAERQWRLRRVNVVQAKYTGIAQRLLLSVQVLR